MKKKYMYGRMFDYCVDDDYKNPGRGVLRRKDRKPKAIFSYILLLGSFIYFIMETSQTRYLGLILAIVSLSSIFETRSGLFTLLNVYNLNIVRRKSIQDILEKFYIYHNRDGRYIKIQEKEMYKIQYHPFIWSVVKICFRDEFNNECIFRISVTNISVKVRLAKDFKKRYFVNNPSVIKSDYKIYTSDLKDVNDIHEFFMFIRDLYRKIKPHVTIIKELK